MVWYLIDSLDVGASVTIVVVLHVLVLLLVALRTYGAAMAHQTPLRSGPVTMVQNGVSETQWRDGWGRQLLLWAGVFSIVPAVLYVALLSLAVSRWSSGRSWLVPVFVSMLIVVVVGFFCWRYWPTQRGLRTPPQGQELPEATSAPTAMDRLYTEPYSAPYGDWREGEGL